MIKKLICLFWGHDLDLDDKREMIDLDFGACWQRAFCKRCQKYKNL